MKKYCDFLNNSPTRTQKACLLHSSVMLFDRISFGLFFIYILAPKPSIPALVTRLADCRKLTGRW